jgi:hypothetical protein
MTAVRRVYFYLVAFVSLLMMAFGLGGLGRAVVRALVTAEATIIRPGIRAEVAENGALVLIGLPVWLLHWWLANRRADAEERAATLRRLYVYGALGAMAIAIATAAQDILQGLFGWFVPEAWERSLASVLENLPWLVVGILLWLFHRQVAIRDRRAVGESGGPETLRRWYVYGVAFVALLYLLQHAARILRLTWETLAGALTGTTVASVPLGLAGTAATALVALAFWVTHWRLLAILPWWSSRSNSARPGKKPEPHDREIDTAIWAQDVRSILRPLYLFAVLAASVAVTLAGAAQLLYYALGRALGIERPGGVGGNLLVAMAGPASVALIYGISWLYHRHALAAQAQAQAELPRQAGVRRLYTYLVSLVALAVMAGGAGGVLWTLADLATNAPRTIGDTDWWRQQISLYVTLLAIGLPVWLAHWGPVAGGARGGDRSRMAAMSLPSDGATAMVAGEPDEARSLARRIYLYATLLAGVLALLGAGAAAVRILLDLALGETATASALTNLARALSVATVAGIGVFYHQRVLRRDLTESRAAAGPERPKPPALAPETVPSNGNTPHPARPYGVVYLVSEQGERSEWYGTPEEATSAEAKIRNAGNTTWVVRVKTET